ncbi:NACHT, LRR and PYD domains-containing protein 12 [Caretta caretta]|uniref:NACHT, LRR and PYD domains-containing protein 12 n=1 Tax=Caretta caretta TaxID=8467 RepID=UPI003D3BEF40
MTTDKNMKEILLDTLDNLSAEKEGDLERFKFSLANANYEKKTIPKGQLQEADDRLKLVDLLCKYYKEQGAVNVAISVLEKINCRDSADKLKEARQKALGPQQTPETSANAYRVKYREHIRNKYSAIKDMNARLGENVKLNSRYTKLIIVKEHRHKKQRENEIVASGRRHEEIISNYASSITIGHLFELDEDGQLPQIVMLLGPAGIGKTLTAIKIMLDWANGELYQSRFDYVFYINCRELNFVSEQGSIEDLIFKNCADQNAPTKEILMNPEKLLFIIDGFDELRFSFNQSESNFSSDPCEKQPVEIVLSSLFRKKVLHKSYLIITTRPTALEKLKQCLEDGHCAERYAEILGFSENAREEYFHKFFRNEEQAIKAYNFVEDREMLFTMCFIPIVCWIICTVLKQQMEAGEDLAQTSRTVTDVYVLYLSSLMKGHSSNSKQQIRMNLKGLCSLAADGVRRQKILFEEDEIKQHGLHTADSLFLNENMFQKDLDCEHVYSFIHLSFQEFFAALSCVLQKEETTVEDSETILKNVKMLLKRDTNNGNSSTLTVRFLFGLLNDERKEEREKMLSCKISPLIKETLVKWVEEKPTVSLFSYVGKKMTSYLEAFHCLYEIQEKKIVQSAMNRYTRLILTEHNFTKMDEIVLSFCIKHCCKLESLCLRQCSFQDEDMPRPCKQPRRAQYQHEPHHSPIYQLCQALMAPNSILKTLNLWSCRLTAAGCGDLADVLRTSHSLTDLYLYNSVEEAGVQLLCGGLKHPNCKLQTLELDSCRVTAAACGDLAAVLTTSRSLTELILGGNELGDSGVRLLCEGLKHPNCKLQRLNLESCRVTAAACGDLAAVLRTSRSLTELHLGYNELGEAGVRLLCEGLKHPNCKLQNLHLKWCRVTAAACGDLAAVLRTSRSLTELHLGYNELGEAGVRLLCEGLKHPNCKLQNLHLDKMYFREEMWAELDAVKDTKPDLVIQIQGSW